MSAILAMSLAMMVELSIDPTRKDEIVGVFVENIDASRNFDGNLQFDILLDPEQPDKVFFFEQWQSLEHQQQYMRWRESTEDRALLDSFLTAPPVFKVFQLPTE